ncbi:hypothetical protein IC614_04120 [Allosphingosinicella flava]|uniref:Uncharacterized protein n=1 Tax=Allosphingosinicella flava TaxID=2771430 RepID=A0A7T2GKY8_9SPHN|nr:hypothetical protein [Sphingosinicella flava]QPQ55783.1 hypothetical protein IC614_04120 [Sphingosinicella flava]
MQPAATIEAIPSAATAEANFPVLPAVQKQVRVFSKMELTAEGDPLRPIPADRVSDRPEIRLFRNFLSQAECEYLIDAAMPLVPAVRHHPS